LLNQWRAIGKTGAKDCAAWLARKNASSRAREFDDTVNDVIPASLGPALAALKEKLSAEKPSAGTRKMSEKALDVINAELQNTVGGSADLTPSNNTKTKNIENVTPGNFNGRYIHYGIREHGMCAAMNGMALHGGIIPYGGTFMVFSDYCRPAIRLAALMGIRVVFVMTHDSIGVGEDGPTHQPVEQLASLRAMPGLVTLRPGDANEVVEAYRYVMQLRHQPAVLALSRQPLPTLDRSAYAAASGVARGAYVLVDAPGGSPDVILIASGSELSLAVEAHGTLLAEGIRARVVSMPSWEIFEQQSQEYRDSVLPPGVKARVAVEQGSTFGWERYVGSAGQVVGMRTFGASAPLKALQKKFGFEPERVAAVARELVAKR
jgi:transketolase